MPANSPLSSLPTTGITGNWEITLTSTTRAPAVYPFGIYLTQSGTTVSGTASWVGEPFPACIVGTIPCAYPYSVLNSSLTGTVDANGNLTLATAASSFPGTLSIAASGTADGVLSGTYTITYSTLVDQGTVSVDKIATLNGTYSGTLKSSVTGASLGVTATLSQSVNAGGVLVPSGSATFTGSPCLLSTATSVSGNLFGNQLNISFGTTNPTSTILLSGTLSSDTKTLVVNYDITGGCGTGDVGSGTLTLQ